MISRSHCPRKSPSRWPERLAAALVLAAAVSASAAAQERGPTPISRDDLRAAIGRLGDLDYPSRMRAGRAVRRAPEALAVPELLEAVREHADGYIRFKALVLLTGFADPRTVDAMIEVLDSPNDRLREVAYGYFEHHPDPGLAPRLLAALDKETGEFVRPSLVRALAPLAAANPAVRAALLRDAGRGVDYFRGAVIEALGDYQVAAATPALIEIARLDGPLQDDAVLALGKMGDKIALAPLAELQRSGSQILQPSLAAAFCLMGQNCGSHLGFLQKTLGFAEDFPGYQELLRAAAAGLGAIGARGGTEAVGILLDVGVPSEDPVRAPVALALGLVALRGTPTLLKALESRPDREDAIALVAEGFDMLEEDLEEERFFVTVRRAYWAAPDGSPARALCERLITKLDF
ncbi:MAG TPA: HEAT repeat domain-containing protein [Vicinamibacterales bacterium]|nr:HEAT repeat domain-containing protein [Vicinamibacterales bacterium]